MGDRVEHEPKLLGNVGLSRRQLIARSAVAAGVVWAAPVVRTASAYAATAAGTTRPCTHFYICGLSLSGNFHPKYPYCFYPSLTQTANGHPRGTGHGGGGSKSEPDSNGDKHSNNHTGSKGRGAGGEDKVLDHTTSTTKSVADMFSTTPTTAPEPDANGDLNSNCHTGSKFRGAGGEDKTGTDEAECATDGGGGSGGSSGSGKCILPKLLENWLRENPDVPLEEPDVCPQITQTGDNGWAVLLPEVTGPNAAARQPRFILGYAWQGTHYSYGYVDPNPANPALLGRRILFPSPVGAEPGVGDGSDLPPISTTTTSSTSTSSTSSTSSTTSTTVPGATTTTKPGAPGSTSTSSTTSTSTTTTTTVPPTTTTSSTTTTTTTTLPPTTTTTLPPPTTTTKPGIGKGGSKQTTTTTRPPTTTTTVPPTTTSSTTTTTIPGSTSTTTTTTTSPGGTTTTTTDPFAQWWIAAHSGVTNPAWDGLKSNGTGTGNGGGNGNGKGATSGDGRKIGFVDTGKGPAGPVGPGALSPSDSLKYSDYFGINEDGSFEPPQGSPIKGVIIIFCMP